MRVPIGRIDSISMSYRHKVISNTREYSLPNTGGRCDAEHLEDPHQNRYQVYPSDSVNNVASQEERGSVMPVYDQQWYKVIDAWSLKYMVVVC